MSGSGDNTARVWSLVSLDCLHVLTGHSGSVNCVAIKVCIKSIVKLYTHGIIMSSNGWQYSDPSMNGNLADKETIIIMLGAIFGL